MKLEMVLAGTQLALCAMVFCVDAACGIAPIRQRLTMAASAAIGAVATLIGASR